MTSAARQTQPMTVEDFLAFLDAHPDERWELIDGEPQMVGGGTLRHNTITLNIVAGLRPYARKSGYRVFGADVIVSRRDDAYFGAVPDVFVHCGAANPMQRLLDNPAIIVEVLSPSTLRRDRNQKLEQYRLMPSVDQIVHVNQDQVRIEMWTRAADTEPEALDGWHLSVLTRLDETAEFRAIAAPIAVADIYDDALPETATA